MEKVRAPAQRKTSPCGCGCPDSREEVSKPETEKKWEKPTLEDVSEKVMAQPYIRFT